MLHSITQNPYSPNSMYYLQLSFLDPSATHWDDKKEGTGITGEEGTGMTNLSFFKLVAKPELL
ncbi:hypothetical protein [Wolbachia endosymbiont (group A) of Brachyopa scutellaris]|uniref:hypothetical protein n=1 Tax=Wolbachia endosymbiont (group A) of Brachyopa scutellaris TaxID=3066140 RepID=UPI0031330ED3